jgi:hypothetical protein
MKSTPRFGTQRSSGIALAVATLFATCAAQAAPTPEELSAVKLYGNVSIAQDSMADWGPWTNFEAPAAGPDVLANLPAGQPEVYRPLGQATAPNVNVDPLGLACAGGSLCGFGVFSDYSYSNSMMKMSAGNDSMVADEHPYMMVGEVVTPAPGGESFSDNLPQTIKLSTTALSSGTVQPRLAQSGELAVEAEASPWGAYVAYSRRTGDKGNNEGFNVATSYSLYVPELAATQVAEVDGEAYLNSYIQGNANSPNISASSGQSIYGVLGLTTPDADMAALRASGATARYSGEMIGRLEGYMTMDANFGNATWTAVFNGGADRVSNYYSVYTRPSASGASILNGQVGFEASGTISGVNINSTSITATDGTIGAGSYVKGAFFGPNANAVGGVYNIIKTREPVTVTTTNTMPVAFVEGPVMMPAPAAPITTTIPGYTNARGVGSFIANRVTRD